MDASFLLIIALAFGAMWLMTSRTRKQQRQVSDFRANLEVGQEVMTGSGLFGTIVAIDDDIITLESTPGNESRWLRAAIAKLVEPPVEDESDGDDDEDYDEDDENESYGAADDEVIEVPDDLSTLPPARDDTDDDEKK
ncbi:preprotein translocase subunit YajC [Cellulomonas sp. P22]|uniref:preprotein translocase subunit YajC n=1 Tax=Cellulomonas sp. P22 TaxID=3373189 RepID=UPI0037ABD08B